MNNFYILDSNDKKWNEHLQYFDHKISDIFYTREFASHAQSTIYKKFEVLCLIAQNNKDSIICPVVKREFKFRNLKFNDLTSLYSMSGPIINNKSNNNLIKFFEKKLDLFCTKEKIINFFIRYSPLIHNYNILPSNAEIHKTGDFVYVNLDNLTKPLMKNFSYRHIKSIRKAINNNIKIIVSNDDIRVLKFCELYYKEMQIKLADKFYFFDKGFFTNLKKSKLNYQFFFAEYEDKIISCELILYSNKYCHSYLGATDREYKNLCPNHLMKAYIIEYFHDLNINFYMIGGGDSGILKYKEGFSNNKKIPNYIGIINYDANLNMIIKKELEKEYNLTNVNKIQFYENIL